LPDHPGQDLHKKQANGFGSIISLLTDSDEHARLVIEKTQLFTISVSFGSLNSLISLPCNMSHASKRDCKESIPQNLIRLSIGIEDADDLIQDLDAALHYAFHKNAMRAVNL